MSYRKILYGYQIQNGELTLVPEEAAVVNRIAGLYLDGLSEAGRPAESEEYPLQPGSAGMGQAQGQTPAGEPPLHRTEGLSGHLRRWDFSLRPEPHSGKNGKTDTQSRAASPQVGKPSALCRLRRGPPSDGRQEPPERHPIPEMCPMRRCHHHAGRSPAG